MCVQMAAVIALLVLGRSGWWFLNQIDLGSGNSASGDKGTVFGANQRQVAFGCVSTVFSGFQFTLEAAHSGYALLWNSLLKNGNGVNL